MWKSDEGKKACLVSEVNGCFHTRVLSVYCDLILMLNLLSLFEGTNVVFVFISGPQIEFSTGLRLPFGTEDPEARLVMQNPLREVLLLCCDCSW